MQDVALRLLGFAHQFALSHKCADVMLIFILLTNTLEDQTNCESEVKILFREHILGYVRKNFM